MISQDFLAFVQEQLQPMRGLAVRRMFGGAGFSVDERTFALIIDNVLYFHVDDATRPLYEQMGSRCFAYTTRVREVQAPSYYAVPADLLEDRDQLLAMARRALATADAKPRPKARARSTAKKAAKTPARTPAQKKQATKP